MIIHAVFPVSIVGAGASAPKAKAGKSSDAAKSHFFIFIPLYPSNPE
jgi:hypothetical protein